MDEDKQTFDVEIYDATVASTYMMTQNEIAEKAVEAVGSWVFVNDQLVCADDIAEMNLEAGSRIRLTPGLAGHRCSHGARFTVNLEGQINEYTGKEIQTLLDAGNKLFLDGAPATYGEFHEFYKALDPRSLEIVAKVVSLTDTAGGTRVARWSDCSSFIRNASGEFLCLFDKMVVRDGDHTSVEPNFEAFHVGHALGNIPNVRLFCLP